MKIKRTYYAHLGIVAWVTGMLLPIGGDMEWRHVVLILIGFVCLICGNIEEDSE